MILLESLIEFSEFVCMILKHRLHNHIVHVTLHVSTDLFSKNFVHHSLESGPAFIGKSAVFIAIW